jgi:uncharacterized protein YkwD
MTLDGQEITFPYQQPVIVDGRTLVPVRGVFEAMGFEVRWDGERQAVSMDNGEWSLDFVVGSPYPMTVLHSRYERPEEGPRPQPSVRFVDFEVRPQIINGSTMIPLRAIAESVGVEVDWDGETRTVSVGPLEWTQTARQPEPAPEPELTQYERVVWFEQETFRLVNEYRVENGLHPFVWHDTLALAARLHSEDVAMNMTGLSHVGSDGSRSSERVTRLGLSGTFGEVMSSRRLSSNPGIGGWQNSPGHRLSMMSSFPTLAGVGVGVDSDGRAVITLKMGTLH